jgi:O-antigen/teichoic acid export membrane protein
VSVSKFEKAVRRGAIWSYAGQGYMTLGNFVVGLIIARILGPSEVGVFIAVTAFTAVFLIGVQFGLPQAILQARVLHDDQVNAAFWSIAALGLLFFCLLWWATTWLAQFYEADVFVGVMRLMGGVFLLTPMTAVGLALLRRDMRFARVAAIDAAALTISSVVSVGAALLGAGVYSLVMGTFSSMLSTLIGLLVSHSWRPSRPSWLPVRSLLHFSSRTMVNNVLSLTTNRVDNMLVGAILNTASLGLYNRAYSLARIPAEQFAESLGPLLFGSLSRIQDDVDRSKRLYLTAAPMIAVLTMPFFVLLGVAGSDLVWLLYGEAWSGAGTPLRVMAAGAVFFMLCVTMRALINAQGLVGQLTGILLALFVATIVVVFGLAPVGLTAVAIGISLREALMFVLMLRLLGRSRLKLTFGDFTAALAPAFIAAVVCLVMTVVTMAWSAAVLPDNRLGRVSTVSFACFASYAVAMLVQLWLWRRHSALAKMREMLVPVAARALWKGRNQTR